MLTAVNTESIPDRGETLKNITEAAANVAGFALPGAAPGVAPVIGDVCM